MGMYVHQLSAIVLSLIDPQLFPCEYGIRTEFESSQNSLVTYSVIGSLTLLGNRLDQLNTGFTYKL